MLKAAQVQNVYFGLSIESLTLDCDLKSPCTAMSFSALNHLYVHNVQVKGADTYGFLADACIVSELDNVLFVSPNGTRAVAVGYISAGGPSTVATLTNVQGEAYGIGLQLKAGASGGSGVGILNCNNCVFENSTSHNYDLQNGSLLTFIGGDGESAGGHGMNVGDLTENAGNTVTHLVVMNGFYHTVAAGKFAINLDHVLLAEFFMPSLGGNTLNITCNAHLVEGSLDLPSAPMIADATALGPGFRYTTNGLAWVYPSTMQQSATECHSAGTRTDHRR